MLNKAGNGFESAAAVDNRIGFISHMFHFQTAETKSYLLFKEKNIQFKTNRCIVRWRSLSLLIKTYLSAREGLLLSITPWF